jgi:hypothetical protein
VSHGIVAGVAAAGLGLLALLPATADDRRSLRTRPTHEAIQVSVSFDLADVDAYTTLLAQAAAADLDRPLDMVPPTHSGVLGSTSAAIERRNQFLRVRLEVARQAWLSAHTRGATTSSGSTHQRSRCNGDFSCFKPCTLQIESHGNYAAVSRNGTYRGAWQFDQRTWNGAVARAGHPEWSNRDPATAPPAVQDAAAAQLYAERGNQPWGGRC